MAAEDIVDERLCGTGHVRGKGREELNPAADDIDHRDDVAMTVSVLRKGADHIDGHGFERLFDAG